MSEVWWTFRENLGGFDFPILSKCSTLAKDLRTRIYSIRLTGSVFDNVFPPQLPPLHEPHQPGNCKLCHKRTSRENEALTEPRGINLRICQQRQPGIEGVAQRIHQPEHDCSFFCVAAADFTAHHYQLCTSDILNATYLAQDIEIGPYGTDARYISNANHFNPLGTFQMASTKAQNKPQNVDNDMNTGLFRQ